MDQFIIRGLGVFPIRGKGLQGMQDFHLRNRNSRLGRMSYSIVYLDPLDEGL